MGGIPEGEYQKRLGKSDHDLVVDTLHFWELMCDPRFQRTSLHCGKIADRWITCGVAPEEVDGFILDRIHDIYISLRPGIVFRIWNALFNRRYPKEWRTL